MRKIGIPLDGEFHGCKPYKLYRIWHAIRQRCSKDYNEAKENYKDRGISVCQEWQNGFVAFRTWALANGYKRGFDIDRIDNNGNYTPENCRFIKRIYNVNNRRNTFMVTYNGHRVSLSLLLHHKGIHHQLENIRRRILSGWDHTLAVDTPVLAGGRKSGIKLRNKYKGISLQIL